MKKLMVAMVLAMMLSGVTSAHAESVGSAVIPTMFITYTNSDNYNFVNIGLSNIVEDEVTCTICVFDHDGEDITSSVLHKVATGSYNSGGSVTIGTSSTFVIPSNQTRFVQLYTPDNKCSIWAHAIVKWTSQNEKIGKALVGTVFSRVKNASNKYGQGVTYINNGQPF